MYIEINKEAFETLKGDTQARTVDDSSGALVEVYISNGVTLKEITNFYSRPVTQYYVQDINY